MPLYIRDSSVDLLAEELRARLGVATKTEAVRTALTHELKRRRKPVPLRDRLAVLQERASERLGLPVHGADMKKIMDDLWEEGGDVR